MRQYIMSPEEFGPLVASGEAFMVGALAEDTYDECLARASAHFDTPLLIITIARKAFAPLNKITLSPLGEKGEATVVEFNPGDQNYPINPDEWAAFRLDEPVYCRIPCVVMAVDRTKFTAPI